MTRAPVPRRLARMSDRARWRAAWATPEALAFLAWAEETTRENRALKEAGLMPPGGYPGPATPRRVISQEEALRLIAR